MKKLVGDPFMSPDVYGRSIRDGLSINLLVSEMEKAVDFARTVLGATIIYSDSDFAILSANGSQWMLHCDHTYLDHPMSGLIKGVEGRGAGAELRLHGRDPDEAESAARMGGHTILAGAMDKPHGRRETFIIDPDGYVWVADIAI